MDSGVSRVLFFFLLALLVASAARTRGGHRRRSPPPPASPSAQTPLVSLHNWGYAYSFEVTNFVAPTTILEIQSIVHNTVLYPSPVRALGNIHSVTACVVSNGTIVDMRGMDKILRLNKNSQGSQTVSVQGGVTLINVHNYLVGQDLELPFAAEIGDATVGSLTSSISKDSGVGDPAVTGSLYKSIVGVTYVNHMGLLVTLTDADNATALAHFKSSEGLLGIVVIVDLLVRPAKLLTFTNRVLPTAEVLNHLSDNYFHVNADTNYWFLLHPEYSLVQERALAEQGAQETDPVTLSVIVNATRASFAKGVLAVALVGKSVGNAPMRWTTYKHKMVNHYGALPAPIGNATVGPRLDFTWFEYPIEKFRVIVEAYMAFWKEFKDAHNDFEPAAAATYFVRRISEKPHGWFSQTGNGFENPGLSFTLDPIYHDPNDPLWQEFLQESVKFAITHGGRVALTQTRFLTREDFLGAPGNVALEEAPNARFTSAYFAQFVKKKTPATPPGTTEVQKDAT